MSSSHDPSSSSFCFSFFLFFFSLVSLYLKESQESAVTALTQDFTAIHAEKSVAHPSAKLRQAVQDVYASFSVNSASSIIPAAAAGDDCLSQVHNQVRR